MHSVEILFTEFVTHNVKRFIVEKPEGYSFTPGQATDVAVDQPDWQDRTRPCTFTSLKDAPFSYPGRLNTFRRSFGDNSI